MRETKQIYTYIPERIIQQKFLSYPKVSHKIYWNIVSLYARFVSSSKSRWHCNHFPRCHSTRSLNQSNTFFLHRQSSANHIDKHISRNAHHLWKIFLSYIFQLYIIDICRFLNRIYFGIECIHISNLQKIEFYGQFQSSYIISNH